MIHTHTFHIPVMGIGYTIDTPLKVSQYGINSVISLVDDILIEKIRKMYCEKFNLGYDEINEKVEDYRAKRITSYLNMLKQLAEKNFEKFRSKVKEMGSIDVNIMTKIDRINFNKGIQLSSEHNDAHAALRGYAESDLASTIILSAGMNPSLYSYMENFKDFFPDKSGFIKKKIAIKVSDYRSALIQGKFLAKKGLWVSEFRVESGLNCGGHAFATDGYLMGPILEEFNKRREELHVAMYEVFLPALQNSGRVVPDSVLNFKITAQGGVGTAEEHKFLLKHYHIDSVGWGTPFLLVPEATNVDTQTLNLLKDAKEEELYLSNISPLGVPFNNLRDNTKDIAKLLRIHNGVPGSPCPKKYVALNSEFTERGICTASRQYQKMKIEELDSENLVEEEYKLRYDSIVEKSCICVGLGTSALLVNDLDTKREGTGVSICPGPNLAYFSKTMTLKQMIDHIYGKVDMINRKDRPNMFIKELDIYINYLKDKIEDTRKAVSAKQVKNLTTFAGNLNEGIEYYQNLFNKVKSFKESKKEIIRSLSEGRSRLALLGREIDCLVSHS